jgi:large subunit ribosomal protein L15
MPLHRRLPKRGFKNIFRKKIAAINIKDLKKFESGGLVDEAELVRRGIIKGQRDGVKLLGSGEIDRPLKIKVNQVSNNARKKIEAAGGSIEVV